MKKNKIGVLLSGRGSNFRAILENIKKGYIKDAEIAVVISDKPDAEGLKYAKQEDIPAFFIDIKEFQNREKYEEKIINILKEYNVALVVLAGYMKIIGENFVKNFKNRIMNIHPALLPSFPGLHSQRKAIKYGVRYSGCTVHFVDEKMDHGPIILQAIVPVFQKDTEESLSIRILKEEHKIYSEAIKLFFEKKLRIDGRKVYIKGKD
jgi:phosphoribosylglycinamide formyltransferase-1